MPDETPKKTKIIIPRDGISTGTSQPRAVYDAVSQRVLEAIGPVTSQRASHVDAGKDMSQAALKVLAHKDGDDDVVYAYRTGVDQPYQIRPEYAEMWFADMTPCGHQVVLGPYPQQERDRALHEEVAWLHEHNIPVCLPCIEQQQKGVYVIGEPPNESNTAKTGIPGIDQSGLPPGEIYVIGGTKNTRFSPSEPAQQLPVRTLPAPKWLGPNIVGVDATKLIQGLPHIDVDYSGIEARLLSYYRREVADALRTRLLAGQDDVEGANGWVEAGDVLSCTVFREDHNSTEKNPPSVSWTFSVTFAPSQCSVADFSFGRV